MSRAGKNIVGITLGSGVGGGIIIDGKLYYGCGNAGEIGHTAINSKGEAEDYLSKKGECKKIKKQK